MDGECGWSWDVGQHPCSWRGGRGQIPLVLNVMAKGGSFKAGAGSPALPAPQSLPSEGSCPCVLGEEVSRETTGPHLQGTDGKGKSDRCEVWVGQEGSNHRVSMLGEGWRTRPGGVRGVGGGGQRAD